VNVLRSLLFAIWLFGGSTILAISYLPTLLMPRTAIRACIRFWGLYVSVGLRVCCGIRVVYRGLEHQPKGAALIAAKHQSMFDVTGAMACLHDVSFVMKKELLSIPMFGWFCLKNGMVPLDRKGGAGALKGMVADVNERFKDDRQVLIFPEGTRIPPGQQGDYKPGIAALYRELNMPCYLIATNSGMHWPGKGFMRYPGTVVFEYLPPIPAGLKRGEFMKELVSRVEAASLALYEENP
jgi:1-acyl-sn-glycerol-3-phosphate acyltransferase